MKCVKMFCLYILFTLLATVTIGQDIHFSQYMHNALNRSPASTGLYNGDMRANAAYRSQWNSVTVPFNTFSFGYDQVIGKIPASGSRNALGLLMNNDRAGDGNLSNFQLLLSFTHLFALGNDSVFFINAGIQTGFAYRKIDINNLTFDNQYNGDIYIPTLLSGEQFEKVNFTYPDLNLGIEWLALFDNTIYTAGISLQHLNQPKQAFLNESVKLPVNKQFNVSAWINNKDLISWNPSIIYMRQKEFRELTGGIEIKFDIRKDVARNYAFGATCHYRVDDAIIPGAALYYNQWRLGLSYDVNTSDFKTASNGRGGPEFNITYIMKKIRYDVRKNNCPVY